MAIGLWRLTSGRRRRPSTRSRILLVPNKPDWALDRAAKGIKSAWSSPAATLDILYPSDIRSAAMLQGYDVVWTGWWKMATELPLLREARELVTWAPDYVWEPWNEDREAEFSHFARVAVPNSKLFSLLEAFLGERLYLAPDATDTRKFYDQGKRLWSDRVRVGWAGNSSHPHDKGVYDIIEPAVDQVPGIHLTVHDVARHAPVLQVPEMCDFYNNIDLYICASRVEGTPLTILESAACGCAVLSTDVGMADEVLVSRDHLFERSPEALAAKLQEVVGKLELVRQWGTEQRRRIQNHYTWQAKLPEWERFLLGT